MLAPDYLEQLHTSADLHGMTEADLCDLATQIRSFLIEKVMESGGHLASNLGVVELTLALHATMNFPHDRLIFDVGHQSYVHKILSGRKDAFDTLRAGDGLSGFTKRSESEYDAFGAGHSSTSVSAAIGFAQADAMAGRDNVTVAVFGDGAFTGGMVHEALNNCPKNARLILILNENEMSISPNIGRYSTHLSRIRCSKGYVHVKQATKSILPKIPLIGKLLYRTFRSLKSKIGRLVYRGNYFEEMGLHYVGVVDGHEIDRLIAVLEDARNSRHTTVIHVKTQKGKGYTPAEEAPDTYHGIAPHGVLSRPSGFSEAFGKTLCELAQEDGRICAITAAMADGTGLIPFQKAYPKRFFDVGIAEEHALTFAAGLAAGQMRPYVALYSTFLQRGYDNIVHDIALQNLPVTIMIDRAGLNLHDGATHHGILDVSFLSAIPNMTLYAPLTYDSLEKAMRLSQKMDSPCAIRYPSGSPDANLEADFVVADPEVLSYRADAKAKETPDYMIVTYGRITVQAQKAQQMLAKEGITCGIVVLEQLKPLCAPLLRLLPLLKDCKKILFLEEGMRAGGVGVAMADTLCRMDLHLPLRVLAIDDTFVETMQKDFYHSAGIGAQDVVEAFRAMP
jgi:1-deoxy-D-xylulose-5-phosphate synthase